MQAKEKARKWIAAAFAALANGGVDRVRVEALAEDLGVTKGGFYRQFKDRDDLLAAMLEDWTEGRIASIENQTELDGESARERLIGIIRLFADKMNPHGLAIELAIRQWARSEPRAARAAAEVDRVRLTRVAALYASMGFQDSEAFVRAHIFYSFIFGSELLFVSTDQADIDFVSAGSGILTGPADSAVDQSNRD